MLKIKCLYFLSFQFISVACPTPHVNGFYSLIIINYGKTYNLSFWYHTTKYINVLNYALQFRRGICPSKIKTQLNG